MTDMTVLQNFLNAEPAGPFVSIYLPREPHEDVAAVQLRLRHLMAHARDVMAEAWPDEDFAPYATQFEVLFDTPQRITGDHGRGLGILSDGARLEIFELDVSVSETAMVTALPQVMPLLADAQNHEDFDLLVLQRDQIALYHHDHHQLQPVTLPADAPQTLKQTLGTELRGGSLNSVSQGQGNVSYHGHNEKSAEEDVDTRRFLQAVDTYVADHCSKPNKRPLALLGLAQTLAVFRDLSRNPHLTDIQIAVSPNNLSQTDLARIAATLRRDFAARAQHDLLSMLDDARSGDRVQTDLGAVIDAVVNGTVAQLLVQIGARVHGELRDGVLDHTSEQAQHNNLLNDLAEQVVMRGGTVHLLPKDQLAAPVVAITRYALPE